MYVDYNVVYTDMPINIHSFVRYNPDDTYTIVINARFSSEYQTKCLYHELFHLRNCDFDKNEDTVDTIEFNAHKED